MISAPIMIVGMHRSGTSCLAGSLQQAGLRLGDVHTANPFNRKGNREHPALMALHEEVLKHNNGAWHKPPAEPVEWLDEHCRERERIIEDISGRGPWGFKDPRALLFIDQWLERFPNAQLVGTLRHPVAVAESLHRRSPGMATVEEFVGLWTDYNSRLLRLWEQRHFPIVDFDKAEADYRADLGQVYRRLGLRQSLWSRWRRGGVGALFRPAEPFFDPALRSQRREGFEGLPKATAELYRTLKSVTL